MLRLASQGAAQDHLPQWPQSVRSDALAAKFGQARDATDPCRVEGKAGSPQFQFRARPVALRRVKT